MFLVRFFVFKQYLVYEKRGLKEQKNQAPSLTLNKNKVFII